MYLGRKKEITPDVVSLFVEHVMAGDEKSVKKMLGKYGRALAAARNDEGQGLIVAAASRKLDTAEERSKAYGVICTLARGGAAAEDIRTTEELIWKNFPRYDFRSVAYTSIHDRWHDAKGIFSKINHYLWDPVIALPSGYYSRAGHAGLVLAIVVTYPLALLLVVGTVAGVVTAHASRPAEEPKEVEPIIIRLKIEQVPPATTSFNGSSAAPVKEITAQKTSAPTLQAAKYG